MHYNFSDMMYYCDFFSGYTTYIFQTYDRGDEVQKYCFKYYKKKIIIALVIVRCNFVKSRISNYHKICNNDLMFFGLLNERKKLWLYGYL